jgi:hypothetical protein
MLYLSIEGAGRIKPEVNYMPRKITTRYGLMGIGEDGRVSAAPMHSKSTKKTRQCWYQRMYVRCYASIHPLQRTHQSASIKDEQVSSAFVADNGARECKDTSVKRIQSLHGSLCFLWAFSAFVSSVRVHINKMRHLPGL